MKSEQEAFLGVCHCLCNSETCLTLAIQLKTRFDINYVSQHAPHNAISFVVGIFFFLASPALMNFTTT